MFVVASTAQNKYGDKMKISILLYYAFQLYFLILIVRIFLTWIPQIDWNKPFFKFLSMASDTYLSPFRKIIPPLSGLDFSPIIALLFLQFVQYALCSSLMRMGL